MKITGYEHGDLPVEEIKFLDLTEITLEATPEELRRIASFLSEAADNMERLGSKYGHEHLSDRRKGFEESPHFVVFRSKSES